jgi:hypothetical protein
MRSLQRYPWASLRFLVGIFALSSLVGCAFGFAPPLNERRAFLAGSQEKTWRMVRAVIHDREQALSSDIQSLTRTYRRDGSWYDSLGNEGAWSFQGGGQILREITTRGLSEPTRLSEILQLNENTLILYFDILDLGTRDIGPGAVTLAPTTTR